METENQSISHMDTGLSSTQEISTEKNGVAITYENPDYIEDPQDFLCAWCDQVVADSFRKNYYTVVDNKKVIPLEHPTIIEVEVCNDCYAKYRTIFLKPYPKIKTILRNKDGTKKVFDYLTDALLASKDDPEAVESIELFGRGTYSSREKLMEAWKNNAFFSARWLTTREFDKHMIEMLKLKLQKTKLLIKTLQTRVDDQDLHEL